ncbi:dienelactone hydrolase family protein [Rhodospirillum centenum]|uniref:Carboxymethylenebutenolidase, putative n=1 Tax=Rhodospirillum centenum (strain ATCC 51521 / SW) TaxID=414684 RepID=B6IV53_RHOCS|nr:dienelactone hydrolase family protein [Rhodospirillum centenum]ACJ00177.1 carboxymethylenebutenolidase, putative [Rhodospirillum centenum SW]
MTDVTIQATDGGSFTGYLAEPPSGQGPGIVVIQEIFGVNEQIRDYCDFLAGQGYFALCPDLFWRQEPGVQLTDRTEAEWQKAFKLYQGFNEVKGVDDLIATMELLRDHPGVTGKVGAVGFCLGGKLAYLMATRSDSDATVAYYGVGIDRHLDECAAITRPLLMHIAGKDSFVPPEAQAQIKDTLGGNSLVAIYDYPDQQHAFARTEGQHWDPDAAQAAEERTLAFFREHLF